MEISKDGKVVATSTEKTVKVIDVAAAAEITKHKLEQDGKEVATVIVGKNAQITVAEYKTVAGKDVKSTEEAFDLTGVTFKSSNTAVAVVDSKGEIIPLREGTATITVSKAGMKDYTISVTVKAEARVATTVTGLENIELSVSETVKDSKTVKVVVKDQYGDNKEITDFTVESSDAAVTVDTSSKTATNGQASFTVKAVKAGTSVITIKDGKKVLGTATVTVKAASTVASYNLELVEGKDTTLDLATKNETDATKKDTVLELDFVSRDAAGLLVGKLGEDTEVASANKPVKTYTVESSDKEVAEVTVDSTTGKFVVNGKKVGKTTITVKQGTITRTSLEVTVVDTTKPTVTAVGGTPLDGKDFDDTLGENTPLGTALTVIKDSDDDATTLTLSYDASKPLGQLPTITFNDETKVSSIAVNGTELGSDELAQLIIKTGGTNFVTQPQTSITLKEITGKLGADLAELGTKITITLENLSGYTTTYTVNLVKKEVTPEVTK